MFFVCDRYADGELTLTYKGGQKCNHTDSQRSTVINFICSNSAGKLISLHAGKFFMLLLSSADFLAHLSHWLMVSYCDRWMSGVYHQQLLQMTSPKLLAGFDQTW